MARDNLELRAEVTSAPLAVAMITFNEAHNMEAVLADLRGFAREVLVVDSYSTDATVDIALAAGARVVQRRFRGFGDQWNFALEALGQAQPWAMKLDPDERLSDALKGSIRQALEAGDADGLVVRRRLWFLGRPLPVRQDILRIWRAGACRFTDVEVNEQPVVGGALRRLEGDLEHHDSPSLDHWLAKQNAYTTAEARQMFEGVGAPARLWGGGSVARRAWAKRLFWRLPGRSVAMHAYCLLVQGAWRAGSTGFAWARLRADLYRHIAYKLAEMRRRGGYAPPEPAPRGAPHPQAEQCG